MPSTVHEKMGIKRTDRVIFRHTPADVISSVIFDETRSARVLRGKFDHVIACYRALADLNVEFLALKKHVKPTGKLWIVWPKAKQLGSDLSVQSVIKIGYDHGMVESTNLSINSVWTALKFTWPKPGKEYNNSYGTLPSTETR